MKAKNFLRYFMSASLVLTSAPIAMAKTKSTKRKPSSQYQYPRPPQFVLLAFDGSLNLDFWDKSFDFANTVATNKDMTDKSGKLRFTYFMSGPYYLSELPNIKSIYKYPTSGNTKSCIGWAEGLSDHKSPDGGLSSITPRVARTNRAYRAGHEMASHVNAHCGQNGNNVKSAGPAWTEQNWNDELRQFDTLIFDVFRNNNLPVPKAKYANGLDFDKSDMIGVRAPLLEMGSGMGAALKKNGYKYDTSASAVAPETWPQRQSWGGWEFPLGYIKVADSTRTKPLIAMDYNWLYFHSAGSNIPNITPKKVEAIKNQVLDSYKYYFKQNYYGNRGPVNIGHHFSMWNGGAYWAAMKEFAQFVCAEPEVRCVTYREYMNWLDKLPSDQLNAYRHAQFDRMQNNGKLAIRDIATPVLADIRLDMGDNAYEVMLQNSADEGKMRVGGWKLQLSANFKSLGTSKITKEELIRQMGQGSSVLIRASLLNRSGVEMDWKTYRIDHLGVEGQETTSGQLEDRASEGEGADAHTED